VLNTLRSAAEGAHAEAILNSLSPSLPAGARAPKDALSRRLIPERGEQRTPGEQSNSEPLATPGQTHYEFEGESQQFWAGELRPGNVHTATGTRELLTACLGKIPPAQGRVPVFARGDKGFSDGVIVEWLPDQQVGFVIVARITGPVKRTLGGLRYRLFRSGLAVAEFRYQPMRWSTSYRFVVVRRPLREDDEAQLTLFQMKQHSDQVLVTNLRVSPLNIWKFYNKRACIEQLIREVKGDSGIGHIPPRQFLANEAYVHLLLLADNCVIWFQRTCLPSHLHAATLQRLREDLLVMPALLIRTGNRPRLRIPDPEMAKVWQAALASIDRLSP
jgi:hypothetical protein